MGAERTQSRTDWTVPRERRITGERRRSAALEAARQLGSATASVVALGAVRDAVLITDRRGIVVFANAAFRALLVPSTHGTPETASLRATSDDSLLGRPVREILEPASQVREILLALRREPSWQGPIGLRAEDGRLVPIELTVTPSVEAEPHASHFVLVARRHEDSARPPSRALDTAARLASELAHDFNNQISVVLNYTFILLRQLSSDSPLREHIAEMQSAAWRTSQVAQELLSFGGPRTTEAEVLELPGVLASLSQLLCGTQSDRIEVDMRLSPVLWRVHARLAHVEWSLLEIALHARRTVGDVERWIVDAWNEETDATGRRVVVQVRAMARPHLDAWTRGAPRYALSMRTIPESPKDMPGVQLALADTRIALTYTRDESGGIAYALHLPAEKIAHAP